MKHFLASLIFVLVCLGASSRAYAWELFRSENQNVADGNARMRANDAAGALRFYDRAARELPSEAGVHLDRGLALLVSDQMDRAREAFLLATDPPASADIRSAAYYNLGLAFYRQADAKAGENDHEEAQRLFREAADSFRRSLRAKPGVRDCAWNLELALRRIREQEQQQQQEEEQEQQQQAENQEQNQEQQQDPQQGENQEQQEQQDPQAENSEQNQEQNQEQNGENQEQQQQEQQAQNPQNPQEQGQPRETEGRENGENAGGEEPSAAEQGEEVPASVARVLDSLEDGEDNLERMRAHLRAARENRMPSKDW